MKGKASTYQKIVDKNKVYEYSTVRFIQDLLNELKFQPEAMAKIFPERVYHYSDVNLSQFWKGNNRYIDGKKCYKRQNSLFEIRANDLEILREKSINRLGAKSLGLLMIIRDYKNKIISMLEFIDKIKKELGRVSGEINVSKEELSFLFGRAHNYISINLKRLKNRENPNYNPNFKFSKETLKKLVGSLKIFKFSFRKVLYIIEKYCSLNPDLKDYSKQQYIITNPNFFSNILQNPAAAYWFGFICADGYITNVRNNYEIGIELSIKDKSHLKKFGELVGFDENRIHQRCRIKCYNSKIKKYKSNEIKFSCKPMYNTLNKLGLDKLKRERKSIPHSIKKIINIAKTHSKNSDIHWSNTSYGKIAYAWLLGFFDGDGRYMGRENPRASKFSAMIYSVSEEFLKSIKEFFEIENEVRNKVPPDKKLFVFDKITISKGFYRITLGPTVFKRMLKSYHNSLYRKRP